MNLKVKEVEISVNAPPLEIWQKLLLQIRNLRKEYIVAHILFGEVASFGRQHFTGFRIHDEELQKEKIMAIKISKKDLISEIHRLIRRDEAKSCKFFIYSTVAPRKKNKKPKKAKQKEAV